MPRINPKKRMRRDILAPCGSPRWTDRDPYRIRIIATVTPADDLQDDVVCFQNAQILMLPALWHRVGRGRRCNQGTGTQEEDSASDHHEAASAASSNACNCA